MSRFRRVCIYCGSSDGVPRRFHEAAAEAGRHLASLGVGLVYGGGRTGLMGAVAEGALGAGGEVIGVIPRKLRELEVSHEGLTELIEVDSMHTRKTVMAALSDAFVALPGGFGTLEEIAEATTWTQLEYHRKPVGLLDVDGYWAPLLAWVEGAAEVGFIRSLHRGLLLHDPSFPLLLERLEQAELPTLKGWLDQL